jgi:hypothetical protein
MFSSIIDDHLPILPLETCSVNHLHNFLMASHFDDYLSNLIDYKIIVAFWLLAVKHHQHLLCSGPMVPIAITSPVLQPLFLLSTLAGRGGSPNIYR